MTDLTAVPEGAAPTEPEDLPTHWSPDAVGTVLAILDASPDLSPAEVSQLWQVGQLETTADELDQLARDAGYLAKGSAGQDVVHPAVTAAISARSTAARILARLVPSAEGARMTRREVGRHAAAARWARR